jgi:hypothetical protein
MTGEDVHGDALHRMPPEERDATPPQPQAARQP